MTDLLANPIWHSLSTLHSNLAQGNHLAKRYPQDIGPLSGIPKQSNECWDALKRIIPSGDHCALFLTEPANLGAGLTLVMQFQIEQMVCESSRVVSSLEVKIEELGEADVTEMLALTTLTEPGPFQQRTIQLGGYRGIRDRGRLVAMAGQRMALPGYREVSAVCTHPSYRGRGYAGALVRAVDGGITALGEIPYLHVRRENFSAIRLYRSLGYDTVRTLHCAIVTRPQAHNSPSK